MSNEDAFKKTVAKRVKQYKNFPGYKGKSVIELTRIAEDRVSIDMLISDLDVASQFDDPIEKKRGVEIAKKYFNDYTFEFISDKNTLKQLIYLEIVNERLQKSLNEFYTDAQAVPVQMMEALHKNVMQITTLKTTLGLVKDNTDDNKSDALKSIDTLKRKFKKWREDNQGSRTLICPKCGDMIMLKMRTDAWEAMGHPWFKDRLLTNEKLIDLYRKRKITRLEFAEVMQTSEDYIDWMMDKLCPTDTIKDLNARLEVQQERIEEDEVQSGTEKGTSTQV